MTINKLYSLLKLKTVLFGIYLFSLGIYLFIALFLDLGYISLKVFFEGFRFFVLLPLWLLGKFDLSGAGPEFIALIMLGDLLFLFVILYLLVSWSRLHTLLSYIVLLIMTLITFNNYYTS